MTDATPEHLTTVAPRLVVGDGNAAIEFHREAFGAEPFATAGRLIHAVLRIGTGTILVTEEGEAPARSPEALGGRASAIMATYWDDPDAVWERARLEGVRAPGNVRLSAH